MKKQLKNRKLGRELISQSKAGKLRDFSRSEVTGIIRDINRVKPMNFAKPTKPTTKDKLKKAAPWAVGTAGLVGTGAIGHALGKDELSADNKKALGVVASTRGNAEDAYELQKVTTSYDNWSDLAKNSGWDEATLKAFLAREEMFQAHLDSMPKTVDEMVEEKFGNYDTGWWGKGWFGDGSKKELEKEIEAYEKEIDTDEDGNNDAYERLSGNDVNLGDRHDVPAVSPGKFTITKTKLPSGAEIARDGITGSDVDESWDSVEELISSS